jgi:hypothetical protein
MVSLRNLLSFVACLYIGDTLLWGRRLPSARASHVLSKASYLLMGILTGSGCFVRGAPLLRSPRSPIREGSNDGVPSVTFFPWSRVGLASPTRS